MRFPPHFLDEIRARLSVSQVVSRSVKLRRQGREFTGLSPFKQEKTPSFTVNDQKGFYHCFATGEHGDIFTFLIKTQGLSFPEAVEQLANEAGVPMPVSSPEAIVKAEQNDRLRELTELAAKFYQDALNAPIADKARNYLIDRGLSREQVTKFRLGYAPNSRNALKQHLEKAGFSEKEIVLSGMAIGGNDIPVPYDRFRDRIMFPIADLKQRVIAFGGRALDPDQPAKYLNSPETPLFHKGHQVYNGALARKSAYDLKSVIVTEGYMDVIAMDSAGFENTVAPLGTALTIEQIQLLWRMASEPILCFDGDQAGKKAAFRAVETVLPHLKPGFSLKFAFLPDGQDPDDYIKDHGAAEMKNILDASKPLSEVLWQKEFTADEWETPERRAALEQNLISLINGVEDQTVKTHYLREIKSRLWRAFQKSGKNLEKSNSNWQKGGKSSAKSYSGKYGANSRQPATNSLLSSPLMKGPEKQNLSHEAEIIDLIITHPWLLDTEDELFSSFKFTTEDAKKLRDALLEAQFVQNPQNSLDSAAVQSHLEKLELHSLAAQMQRKVTQTGAKSAEPNANSNEVLRKWHELMVLHHKAEELERELDAAERAYREEDNQLNFDRLESLRKALTQSMNEVL
ncbi:MAG: DNA primase [Methyloligella sp.]|nr:MAG: DNA primase [Methyloligella sp.]